MGTDPYPWVCCHTLPWHYVNSNYDCHMDLQNSALPNPRPISSTFPSYADRFGFVVCGDAPPAAGAPRFPQRRATIHPPLEAMNAPPEAVVAAAERRFLIFDQSGDGTGILFSSIGPSFWSLNHKSPKPKPSAKCGIGVGDVPLPGSSYVPLNLSGGTTEVSDAGGCSAMREDTEEIDALLYSDSEFEEGADEWEEAFTGQLPEGPTGTAEEVCSNSVPTKRRRLTEEEAIDASLTDTANSARVQQKPCIRCEEDVIAGSKGSSSDDESSCVGGGGAIAEQGPPTTGKGLRKARIQETLCVLRKIIPGGKGKDDAAVLDEAIRYLRSLKIKAKGASGNKLK